MVWTCARKRAAPCEQWPFICGGNRLGHSMPNHLNATVWASYDIPPAPDDSSWVAAISWDNSDLACASMLSLVNICWHPNEISTQMSFRSVTLSLSQRQWRTGGPRWPHAGRKMDMEATNPPLSHTLKGTPPPLSSCPESLPSLWSTMDKHLKMRNQLVQFYAPTIVRHDERSKALLTDTLARGTSGASTILHLPSFSLSQ